MNCEYPGAKPCKEKATHIIKYVGDLDIMADTHQYCEQHSEIYQNSFNFEVTKNGESKDN